jgi:hypothetical protein
MISQASCTVSAAFRITVISPFIVGACGWLNSDVNRGEIARISSRAEEINCIKGSFSEDICVSAYSRRAASSELDKKVMKKAQKWTL